MKLSTTRLLLIALVLGQSLSGCATPLEYREELYQTFPDALRTCRQQQPGRLSRRVNLPATHPHVAQCLKRHDWNPDGSRIEPNVGARATRDSR